jgi:hypothetical protein
VGKRYKDLEELKPAVREQCLAEWRAITTSAKRPNGVEWNERFAADFADRQIPEIEQEEQRVAADLLAALKGALRFYEERLGQSAFASWVIPNLLGEMVGGPLFAIAPEYVRLPNGRPAVDWGQLGRLEHYAKPQKGWLVSVSGRIVSLLTDGAYCSRFGLNEPANSRTMAIVALLVGEWPTRKRWNSHGPTVYEVIEAEQEAIAEAMRRHQRALAEWRRQIAAQRAL